MGTALFAPFLADDSTIYGNPFTTANTVTKGDFVAASGSGIAAVNSAYAGMRTSGMGIALENNPWYDELGVARVNTALAILRRGIIRVTAMSAATASLNFSPVFPSTTSSGIVGQTGLTGVGPIWVTAPVFLASGATGASQPSGVAKLLNVVSVGSTGQWDILLTPDWNGFI